MEMDNYTDLSLDDSIFKVFLVTCNMHYDLELNPKIQIMKK